MQRFGEHHRFLQHPRPLAILQRQLIGKAVLLLQQLWANDALLSIRPANQLNTYEHNGDAYWLEYLDPSVLENPLSAQQEYSNYMLQLASIESKMYGEVNQKYISALRQTSDFKSCRGEGFDRVQDSPSHKQHLRVGWITGDLCPHPVSRFLLGFFHALNQENTQQHPFDQCD